MEKKLPGIYANKIEKKLNNNNSVYYSDSKDEIRIEERNESVTKNSTKDLNINQKINNIFNSNRYVYKADVLITTREGKATKKVIGQNKTHLITFDNELIPISDIIDIDFSD